MVKDELNKVEKLGIRPFTRFCMSIGAVPSSYLAGLSIEEQLLWLCSYLEKEVIPTVNNNGQAVEELQELFVELKNYVDNYFDNLDVQEEINNKLDDMADSGELEEIIGAYLNTKTIFCFDNVDSMKQSENLISGSFAKTLGFYEKNDKGSALYKIREREESDIESNLLIELDNGLMAEFVIVNDFINVKQYGIKEDDTTDETTITQNLIDYANENNLKIKGNYSPIKLTSSIDIPAYLDIENIYFKFYESNNYINSFCIYVNANTTHNDWKITYPSNLKGSLKHSKIENSTQNKYNGIYNYSNGTFDELVFTGFNISFQTGNNYLDSWKFTNCNITSRYVSDDYNLIFGFLGDSIKIENLHYMGVHGTNIIQMGSGHNGIVLNNIICHGNIRCAGSNVTFNNLHIEDKSATITLVKTLCKISNAFIYHNTSASEHNIEINDNSKLTLENVKFMYFPKLDDNSTDDIDVNINSGDLNVINSYKFIDDNGNIAGYYLNAIKTNKNISIATNYSLTTNSNKVSFVNNNQVLKNKSIYASGTNANATWKIESSTYHYYFQPIVDFDRMIVNSVGSAKYSQELTNGGNGFFINTPSMGFWRIYRGLAENQYNKYVDICVIDGNIYDNGIFINGYKWLDRTTGTADGTGLYIDQNNIINYNGENMTLSGGYQKPTSGTWKTNDIIWYRDATDESGKGWLCKTGGSPGTWVVMH